MGSLQVGLAVLGALVLAGLTAHGVWQSRKWRRPQGAASPDLRQAIEPSFGPPAEPPAAAAALPDVPRRPVPGAPLLDPVIDAIAPLRLDVPIEAETVLAHLPPTRRVGSKPLAIEGLDARTGKWLPLHAAGTCVELQAGVQLASRSGALNEIEYSEFVQKMQAFADAVGASAEFPDMLDVVARARELDGFAGQHDAQLAMRLHAKGSAWSVGFIQQQAGRLGFLPGALPGRLVLPGAADGAPPVLTLQFDRQAALAGEPSQAAVRELTLAFDVPQTPAAQEPFKVWQDAGEALAQALGARVSDDQGSPLQAGSLGVIGEELAGLYDKLSGCGLPAGSAAARRLFS
ncbi:MAG TPA: cell division protein FtsZ [Burkholderiaceae bacterium]|nr:cell division protein FtsZ [Burkholderiaceae bacterium]